MDIICCTCENTNLVHTRTHTHTHTQPTQRHIANTKTAIYIARKRLPYTGTGHYPRHYPNVCVSSQSRCDSHQVTSINEIKGTKRYLHSPSGKTIDMQTVDITLHPELLH